MNITNYTKYQVNTLLNDLSDELNISEDVCLTLSINDSLMEKFDSMVLDAILYKSPLKNNYSLILTSHPSTDIRKIICHEMVHLKQYEDGILDYIPPKTFYWKGKEFPIVEYNLRPWEREAFKKQNKLFKKYCLL